MAHVTTEDPSTQVCRADPAAAPAAVRRSDPGLQAGEPDPEAPDERRESDEQVRRRYLRERPPHHGG